MAGLALVGVLIAITGFFVAGEFALVAVDRSRVGRLADQGDRTAARLLSRLRDLSFELSGAQLGITVTSLLIGAIAEPTVAEVLAGPLRQVGIDGNAAVVGIALALATLVQMVVGELLPKNLAIARPYGLAVAVGLPMATVNGFLRPVIVFFNAAADWTVRRFGIEPRGELAGLRSLRELELIVRASSAGGHLDEVESRILTRAIAFVEKDAADAMIPRVSLMAISATVMVEELRSVAVATGHSRFPIHNGDLDSIVGIVHVKDSFRLSATERATTPVEDIAKTAVMVPETMQLDRLLVRLQSSGQGMAVVIDEYGGTAGIVTVEDIIEEILGEIEDEHDTPEEAEPGLGIPGRLHRHEVELLTGFEWPEGSYETLNGFVTARLGRFPRIGDRVEQDGYQIEVTAVDGPVAEYLVITPVQKGRLR